MGLNTLHLLKLTFLLIRTNKFIYLLEDERRDHLVIYLLDDERRDHLVIYLLDDERRDHLVIYLLHDERRDHLVIYLLDDEGSYNRERGPSPLCIFEVMWDKGPSPYPCVFI